MAKKKKISQQTQIIIFGIALLGVAAFVMMFFEVLKAEVLFTVNYYEGLKVAFGSEDVFKFNFLAALAFILPLIAGILAVFPIKMKQNKKMIIVAGLFIIGAVLLFLLPTYINMYLGDTVLNIDFKLATCGLVAAICATVGGLGSIATIVI